jgi:IQ and AAA domain-containing protein
MLREEILPLVEKNLQATIDKMLDLELANMRILTGVKAKKKKKGKKKGKKGKKSKKKKIKLPGGVWFTKMEPYDMLVELVKNSIVKKLPASNLQDFLGEFNFIGSMMDNVEPGKDKGPQAPSMALIRQLVTEYIIFPLGSELQRKRHPEHTMSFLFYGPPGTGKTQMVRAIATETRSIMYDLSPNTIKDVYNADKKDAEKLVALTMMAAKKYGPSIIYIDECEKVFPGKKKKGKKKGAKKKKAADQGNAKRIKKAIMKWRAKWLTDETNITVIGCSSDPSAGSQKDFKKFFKHSLYFPFPDYTTRRHMWRTFIENQANI